MDQMSLVQRTGEGSSWPTIWLRRQHLRRNCFLGQTLAHDLLEGLHWDKQPHFRFYMKLKLSLYTETKLPRDRKLSLYLGQDPCKLGHHRDCATCSQLSSQGESKYHVLTATVSHLLQELLPKERVLLSPDSSSWWLNGSLCTAGPSSHGESISGSEATQRYRLGNGSWVKWT